ncbi:MAG: TlpA family protein disulfide reductase [Phycisphaerales bacterium]|nr:TlpA family protein disulfide reductase [Phycisphaerales bacterium]
MLARARAYQSLYPGGPRREDAMERELAALFELITEKGLPAGELCARAEQIVRNPPSRRALHDAAYWRMLCEVERRRAAAAPSSNGKSASVLDRDPELLAAYAEYARQFPDARRTPRLVQTLFEDAAARADKPGMREALSLFGSDDSPAVHFAAATLRRFESVGRPFWVTFRDSTSGHPVDTREWVGRDVLIVVWAGFDPASRDAVAKVEQLRAGDSRWQVVGVSLDAPPSAGQRAASELGIQWPQWNDGLGLAGAFVREWGIREVPFLVRLDSEGRMAGFYSGPDAATRAMAPQ